MARPEDSDGSVSDAEPAQPSAVLNDLLAVVDMGKKKRVVDPSKPRKPNPWIAYVAEVKAAHPELSYKEVLISAKGSYHKS
jgi:hypothetical protein